MVSYLLLESWIFNHRNRAYTVTNADGGVVIVLSETYFGRVHSVSKGISVSQPKIQRDAEVQALMSELTHQIVQANICDSQT